VLRHAFAGAMEEGKEMAEQPTSGSAQRHSAECRCGAVRVDCRGEPVRISACHCLACQRRSGSAFAVQARFAVRDVIIEGETRDYIRTADSGRRARYRFCPLCGSTVAYENEGMPGVIAVPVGAFADPAFPAPGVSTYERHKHGWVAINGDDVSHEP
jgi:hypothetical protein